MSGYCKCGQPGCANEGKRESAKATEDIIAARVTAAVAAALRPLDDLLPHHWINQNGRCDSGSTMDAGDEWQSVYLGHALRAAVQQGRQEAGAK